ncbi:hypothetical protein LMG31506_04068 [Cupriavidus yeoncheonensis]|uniref:Uncharacterized protein n=1 Tax=Cupriavidus yeoncheonensis TaxID=1462994 RepID=A0A916IVE4_9BURK|nr:hypothetical protein LMG31506_04068 [Cupriavidus yeoncheonensis]
MHRAVLVTGKVALESHPESRCPLQSAREPEDVNLHEVDAPAVVLDTV